MPGRLAFNDGCISFFDHFSLHVHVDLKVDVCSVDIRVPEPVADHVDIIARAQQMHRGCMAQCVGGNGFSLERRALICGDGCIFADDVADSKACDWHTIGVEEQSSGFRLLGAALPYVIFERGNCFGP